MDSTKGAHIRSQHAQTNEGLHRDCPGERYTAGVDDLATLAKMPEKFDGAIWTNRADLIGPTVRARP